VGLVAGGRAELDLSIVLRKRITIKGTVMRSRPLEERIAAAQVLGRNIAPLVGRGVYRAVIDQVLPLAQAGRAHALLAANDSFGKIVLTT
jgi:NADPH:quinone reductase-like Zn-dependent oxidoreductase